MYMSYQDLEIEQKRDLDYKLQKAIDAIAIAFSYTKHRPAIAFSGGKDSTVLWHIIKTYFPEWTDRIVIIYGNTGVEYPECLKFARQLGREWGRENFFEATPAKTEKEGLKYKAQQEVLEYLIQNNKVSEVLKEDGKLKTTTTLENACPAHLREKFERERLIWRPGSRMNFWWCIDQYGWPILGKAFSKLKARRINIDCFLQFSQSQSQKKNLLSYYEVLKKAKISQACCDVLKKEPSERLQAQLDVDVIFKGLMASESRTRQTNFLTRGYHFESSRPHLKKYEHPFWHCNPISIWTDEDIWTYIHRYNVPYSSLYDMGWTDTDGKFHKIKRNGCIGCGTDILYPNNHMAMLRRTHPKHWEIIMRKGMAEQLRNIQILKRNGQPNLFDIFEIEDILEMRPCYFDRIDKLVLEDNTKDDQEEFDPEAI